ncbi:miraculin-like [Primulina eburnea]|uniref:miraculin-like n=1 Tax=Primulina eburnea TaxID=1245227 RepID=UPI003C6BFCC6
MKNLIFIATLLIFMLNTSDNVISAEAQDEKADPVLDWEGNELTTGNRYYVLSVFRPGGGVTIYPRANKKCTNRVAQLVFGNGLPVTFAYGGTDPENVVRESTDLTISFPFGTFLFPTEWKVDEYDADAEQYFVTAGESDSNGTSINSWFQIRKESGDLGYRFFSCPKVCESCAKICTKVGIYLDEDGVRHFALNGNFRSSTFTFRKFEESTNSNLLEA